MKTSPLSHNSIWHAVQCKHVGGNLTTNESRFTDLLFIRCALMDFVRALTWLVWPCHAQVLRPALILHYLSSWSFPAAHPVIITTFIIHYTLTLSLQAQNIFQQILPTLIHIVPLDCLHGSWDCRDRISRF